MPALILSFSRAVPGAFKIRVEPLGGEKRRKVAAAFGYRISFPAGAKNFRLPKNRFAKRVSPLTLSSEGGNLWLANPFSFRVENGAPALEPEKLSARGGGAGTLKSAFLSASKNHFPPDGELPQKIFFTERRAIAGLEPARNRNRAGILKCARTMRERSLPRGPFIAGGGWDGYCGMLKFGADKFPYSEENAPACPSQTFRQTGRIRADRKTAAFKL